MKMNVKYTKRILKSSYEHIHSKVSSFVSMTEKGGGIHRAANSKRPPGLDPKEGKKAMKTVSKPSKGQNETSSHEV